MTEVEKSKRTVKRRAAAVALPDDYDSVLADALETIRSGRRQTRAAVATAANQGKMLTFHRLGQLVLSRQNDEGWGTKVIDRLAQDLKDNDPSGSWSRRNLHYMRQVAEVFPDEAAFVQQPAAQMPWTSLTYLLDKFADKPDVMNYYATRAIREGLGRPRLEALILTAPHKRKGAAQSNYAVTLPPGTSELVQESLNDPVNLAFLGVTDAIAELDLESRLVAQVQRTMLELGYNLAFVGRQVPVSVGTKDFSIDLLFFNVEALCFTVVELKVVEYQPEFAGKMNLYIKAVDAQRRNADIHRPTVGIILVPGKDIEVVEASIPGMLPMAVATYTLDVLPAATELGPAEVKALPAAPQ